MERKRWVRLRRNSRRPSCLLINLHKIIPIVRGFVNGDGTPPKKLTSSYGLIEITVSMTLSEFLENMLKFSKATCEGVFGFNAFAIRYMVRLTEDRERGMSDTNSS